GVAVSFLTSPSVPSVFLSRTSQERDPCHCEPSLNPPLESSVNCLSISVYFAYQQICFIYVCFFFSPLFLSLSVFLFLLLH
uniref:Uncharacterized protein n=1 Tax=Sus scrofa TaxID=9823 RepID=A0A8D1YUJ7_PIG